MSLTRNNKGYLIIESMVAIGLITVSILGIFRLVASSIGLNRDLANRFTATYLAAEGIEVVKNIIDINFSKSGIAWNSGLNDGVYQIEYNTIALDSGIGRVGDIHGEVVGSSRPLSYNPNRGIYYYSINSGEETVFKRNVEIENISRDEIKVRGIVTWFGKNNAKTTVFVEDHFFNWR